MSTHTVSLLRRKIFVAPSACDIEIVRSRNQKFAVRAPMISNKMHRCGHQADRQFREADRELFLVKEGSNLTKVLRVGDETEAGIGGMSGVLG